MAQNYTVKNFEGVMKEYDALLMEANRKNIMLSVALGEIQEENEYLKSEMEKLKGETQAESKDTETPKDNKSKK